MRSLEIDSIDGPLSRACAAPRVDFSLYPEIDGYLVETDQFAEHFAQHRMYPASPSASIDLEALLLFQAWLARLGQLFDAGSWPWLPIAKVGPVLVLGHMLAEGQSPPIPWGLFQPVCLRRDDYLRHLANVVLILDGPGASPEQAAAMFHGGVGRFPETIVMPTDIDNTRRFVREYFLHRHDYLEQLDALLSSDAGGEELSPTYESAVQFILGHVAVVPAANLRFTESAQRHLPESMRKRITVVSEAGEHLWCAASSLPQPDAEDRIYAELGSGWTVHWLLRAPEDEAGRPILSSTPGTHTPFKIVLPTAAGNRATAADVVESEERLVALQEQEWERFDPRHRDSAEPEALWKWAVYKALIEGATDVHIEPGSRVTRVRQRVDGLLEELLEVPPAVGEAMVYSLMTQVGLGGDKYRPVDGSFQIEIFGKVAGRHQSVRVRANAYPVRGVTQKLALRFLPRQGAVPALENLLPPRSARFVARAISRPEGLILVCGPTGSGKTTTIFSALSVLNRPDLNVTTLENPVEILLEGTNQAEVSPRRDVTWSALNRAFLRQDPDVGLIGEIRDEDTAKTILRAALTGHLVFGSLHTKSCATSVIRMTDLGAEPNMLAESLILVACQRLVRRICPKCREQHAPSVQEYRLFEKHRVAAPAALSRPSAHSAQCEHCRGRGYRGRAAAVEVLPNVPAVRRFIEEEEVSQVYTEWMKAHGLPTVFENALELASSGITSMEEALTLQDAWEGAEWENLY